MILIKNMKIQVFGPGCPNCKKLFELTKEAAGQLGLKDEIEYIDDIEKMIELGVMSGPALVVDGKIVMAGSVPSIERIKELLCLEDNPT